MSSAIPNLDTGRPPLLRYPRAALGLPAGSIRALLAFMVLGVLWLLGWKAPQGEDAPVTYGYLQYVMILVLAHYFAAHGSTIGHKVSGRSPLWLPAGSIRFLLLVGYLGLFAWVWQYRPEMDLLPSVPLFVPALMVTGFFAGFLITKAIKAVSRGGEIPYWFQDIQAWLALLAVVGLGIIVMVRLIINRNLPQELNIEPRILDSSVATIVGFYFGSRS